MTERNEHEAMGEENAASSSSAKSMPRKAPPTPRALPLWRVLLHNDDTNYIDDVVAALQKLTPLSKEDAVARVLEAQHQGISLLLVTHQERAELYVEQFASCKLTVTAEPEA